MGSATGSTGAEGVGGGRRSLGQWLAASHLLVLGLPLVAFLGTGALTRDLIDQARISMLDQGALISLLVQQQLQLADAGTLAPSPALDQLTATVARASHAAVRILGPDGVVLATSGPRQGEDLSAQPEVSWTLQHQEQSWQVRPAPAPDPTRPGPTPSLLFRTRIYVTNPLPTPDGRGGVVLLSRSPRQTLEAVGHMGTRLSVGLTLALLVTLLVSVGSSHALTRSLADLARAAHRLAEGDLAAAQHLDAPRRSRVREVHALAEAFAQMTDRLRSRLTYIREFASNVSHEFKTPLSTLRGTLELLDEDPEMPPAQRTRFLHNALAEVARLSALVSGLLELARAEEPSDRMPVDLSALLEDVVSRYPGVSRLRAAAPCPPLSGDARQVEVVVRNLLDNAHRHGAPPIHIEETAQGFVVVDAGAGISEGNLPRLFERFFTTDRQAGTGLGLALARTIVRAHGGDITVESRPGRTAFCVTFRAEGATLRAPGGTPPPRH